MEGGEASRAAVVGRAPRGEGEAWWGAAAAPLQAARAGESGREA